MIELFLLALPITEFDQVKLEVLLRKIPDAYLRSEVKNGMERKYYSYPKDNEDFSIHCEADHYLSSEIPSRANCHINVAKNLDARVEEHLVEITDSAQVKNFFSAISYNSENKKFYSSEKVFGLGINGRYQENFRYAFNCSKIKCQFTFSTSER
jgi:hypothetical protein